MLFLAVIGTIRNRTLPNGIYFTLHWFYQKYRIQHIDILYVRSSPFTIYFCKEWHSHRTNVCHLIPCNVPGSSLESRSFQFYKLNVFYRGTYPGACSIFGFWASLFGRSDRVRDLAWSRICVRGAQARFCRHRTAESRQWWKFGPQNWGLRQPGPPGPP